MSASMYPIGQAPRTDKKIFDCSICDDLPALEIEADTEDEAKQIYLAAVVRALTLDKITAIEVDLV
ncbi:hypothetical protein AWB80_07518 [Caballeronia pedi]|uniref:Uncharacterized protein n=1 Tax=Caballeronia pedi TaxID=1777141 RepID=A0A158DUY3_9BURK|nr:hypothetical protein [Caballeronia pedi]SAK98432.1 hypothetical protein AWB80_07518 [Caballeronia pedi]